MEANQTIGSSNETLNQTFHELPDADERSLNESTASESSFFNLVRLKNKKQLLEDVKTLKDELKKLKKENRKLLAETVELSSKHLEEKRILESELSRFAETTAKLESDLSECRTQQCEKKTVREDDLAKSIAQNKVVLQAHASRIRDQENEITKLKEDVIRRDIENENLRTTNSQLERDVEASDKTIGLLQDDLSRLQKQLTKPSLLNAPAISKTPSSTEERLLALERTVAGLVKSSIASHSPSTNPSQGNDTKPGNRSQTQTYSAAAKKPKPTKTKPKPTTAKPTTAKPEAGKKSTKSTSKAAPTNSGPNTTPIPTPRTSLSNRGTQRSAPSSQREKQTPPTKKLLVIGDASIKHVAAATRDANTAVLCWPGIKLEEVVKRFDTIKTEPTCALLLSVGLSDIKGSDRPEDVVRSVDRLLLAAKKRFPKIKIILHGPMRRADRENSYTEALIMGCRAASKKRQTVFLDSSDSIKNGHLAKDGIHLNREGSHIFGNFLAGVKQMVQGNF